MNTVLTCVDIENFFRFVASLLVVVITSAKLFVMKEHVESVPSLYRELALVAKVSQHYHVLKMFLLAMILAGNYWNVGGIIAHKNVIRINAAL